MYLMRRVLIIHDEYIDSGWQKERGSRTSIIEHPTDRSS